VLSVVKFFFLRHSGEKAVKFDKDVCIMTLCMAFALCGAGVLAPARAAQPDVRRSVASIASTAVDTNAATADSGDDSLDDDSDLLGQWTDPKYMEEAHVQMRGIVVLFLLTVAVGLRRRHNLRVPS
jgi:hypothetical protein